MPLLPLFLSLLSCGGNRCGGTTEEEARFGFDDAEVASAIAWSATADTAHTTDTADTGLLAVSCASLCLSAIGNGEVHDCEPRPPEDGEAAAIWCRFTEECTAGRSHATLRTRPPTDDLLAPVLARMAYDERASVHAFRALAVELAEHGAPASLLVRVARAADDEVRHAAQLAALAARHGVQVPSPEVDPPTRRSLEAIAIENAIEGLVGETWSALQLHHQTRHAAPALRPLLAAIADDETAHAELAQAIDGWCRSRLDDDARARVDEAARWAVRRLVEATTPGPVRGPDAELGLPSAATRRRLLAGLTATYWRARAYAA